MRHDNLYVGVIDSGCTKWRRWLIFSASWAASYRGVVAVIDTRCDGVGGGEVVFA